MKKTRVALAVTILTVGALAPLATKADEMEPVTYEVSDLAALASGMNFQGRLNDGGVPTTGSYDFEFRLYDALAAGAQVGITVLVGDLAVVNGLFTVELNFGDALLGGDDRWVQIGVRDGLSVGPYTILAPRTKLTSTPHSLAMPNVYTDPGNNFVGIGRSIRISANEVFGMRRVAAANQYGGMFVETTDPNSWPFYGYATNGAFRAWTYLDDDQPDSASWKLYLDGERLRVPSTGGLRIGPSANYSLVIENTTGTDGIRVLDTGDDGIQIGSDPNYPNYGLYIPSPGVSTYGLWPNTANVSGEWALFTVDNIDAGNVAANTFSVVARAGAGTPLEVGDVAAVTGVGDAIPGGHQRLPFVTTADQTFTGIIGVVEKRMVLKAAEGKEMEGELALHSAPGPARDGDYVSLVIYGIAQVKVDPANAIEVGQRLTSSHLPGRARALRKQSLNGMMVAEDAPSIGIALKSPATGEETVPVFVTLK